MNPFEIKIDGKSYEYIDSKVVNSKNYVLYADKDNLYISEYIIKDNQIILYVVDDSILPMLKEVFNIDWFSIYNG